jgi:nucleoside-diphosphate-sugar epimerase
MARVFVTGATGVIGGALVARLRDRGDEVVALHPVADDPDPSPIGIGMPRAARARPRASRWLTSERSRLAAFLPARSASRVAPAEALRYE